MSNVPYKVEPKPSKKGKDTSVEEQPKGIIKSTKCFKSTKTMKVCKTM